MSAITRTMTIGDVLEFYSKYSRELAATMEKYGLHCVGCHANTFETLEQGVLGHGLGEDVLNLMVKDLNAIVSKPRPASDGTPPQSMELIITDAAMKRIKELRAAEAVPNQGLYLAVVAGGCAGASYEMKFMPEPAPGDVVLERDGVKIFVEKDSVSLLNGLQINYTSSMMESAFKFENPNASGSCGCGTSFSF